MQRPQMMLRATVSAVRAGLEMMLRATVEDALADVWDVMMRCPVPLVGPTPVYSQLSLFGVGR